MELTEWLLADSEPSLLHQVNRDLLGMPAAALGEKQKEIGLSGQARLLLQYRKKDGHWGNGAYNPKWTCTHYVLFELLQLGMRSDHGECRESVHLLLDYPLGLDGGVNYAKTVRYSDVCINGVLLNIASYFDVKHDTVPLMIDYLLAVQMPDGGWNCEYNHGARHSSLHTTIAVLEGISRYLGHPGGRRVKDLSAASRRAVEFILRHEVFKSETTGEVIKDDFFKFSFPVRWKYDILRCLDYFQANDVPFDERMVPALTALSESRTGNGTWKAYSQPGKTYGVPEKNGSDGKWNTLRALRVFAKYKKG